MFLEINLGLLSAAAIIASLMTFEAQRNIEARIMMQIIFCYGVSALFSTIVLALILTGTGSEILIFPIITIRYIITSFSLASFIVGTELLIISAYRHFRATLSM